MFDNNSLLVTWEKARSNVFRLQRRILKSVYVGDFFYALKLQKLLLVSNSARFLSIRFVLQSIDKKRLHSLDNKLSLTYLEKFQLNNLLLKKSNNWTPGKFKEVLVSDDSLNTFIKVKIWSLPDRCWHCLIKLAIEPAHEAMSSPRNFSFGGLSSLHKMQKVISLNLMYESYGLQKRILIMNFRNTIENFNIILLLKKLLAPRSVKLGIFRFLKLGLRLEFNERLKDINFLGFFLLDVLINDVDYFSNSVRVGGNLLIFLKPSDNELFLVNKIFNFMSIIGIDKV